MSLVVRMAKPPPKVRVPDLPPQAAVPPSPPAGGRRRDSRMEKELDDLVKRVRSRMRPAKPPG